MEILSLAWENWGAKKSMKSCPSACLVGSAVKHHPDEGVMKFSVMVYILEDRSKGSMRIRFVVFRLTVVFRRMNGLKQG